MTADRDENDDCHGSSDAMDLPVGEKNVIAFPHEHHWALQQEWLAVFGGASQVTLIDFTPGSGAKLLGVLLSNGRGIGVAMCGPLASACEMDHRQLGELGEAEEVGDYQPVAQAGCFGPVGEKQQAHPIPEACSGPTHSQGLSPAHAQPCRGRVWIQPWPCSRWKCWKCGGESAGGIWPSADLELCKSWSLTSTLAWYVATT